MGSAIRDAVAEACLGIAHHCRVQRPNQVCQPLYRSARSAASAAVDCSAVSGIEVATAAVPAPARSAGQELGPDHPAAVVAFGSPAGRQLGQQAEPVLGTGGGPGSVGQ